MKDNFIEMITYFFVSTGKENETETETETKLLKFNK
jgi:hypothetical protein